MATLNNPEEAQALSNQVGTPVELDCSDLTYEQVKRILAWNSACIVAALDKLDNDLYDLGSINWGDATEGSQKQWGKNHADLWIPARDVHKAVTEVITAAKNSPDTSPEAEKNANREEIG